MSSKFEIILTKLKSNANPQKAVEMKQYMRNRFEFLGVQTPTWRVLIKEFIKEEKKNKVIDWAFIWECYRSEYREMHYVACDYLQAMSKWLEYDNILELYDLASRHQWWDTIDRLDRIIGNIGLKDKRVDAVMLNWSQSDNFWIRRLAIDHQIGRKDKTNVPLLKQIILNNLGSDEFFINKAIGWSLREYAKTNPQWVKAFLDEHQHQLAPLSYREASKNLN